MTDSTDAQDEAVAEETLDEVAEEAVEGEAATEDEEVKADSDSQEDEDEDEEEDKQYVTAGDLKEIVGEIVKGVAEPVQSLQAELTKMRVDLDALSEDLDSLKQTEDVRVTEKAQSTPAASLSAIIARTIVGQEGAQLDYNKERQLRNASPEETDSNLSGDAITGIASIDSLIQKQRTNRVRLAQ